jgi:osmotically-inducible protein OsmY
MLTSAEADLRLRYLVIRELDWDPQVHAAEVDVSAAGDAVTLNGVTDTLASKRAAERAVKRVRGVHGVSNRIAVHPNFVRTDGELTKDAGSVLACNASLPDSLHVAADHGVLTLTGTVEWIFQRDLAEQLVAGMRGVIDVHNQVLVNSPATCIDLRRRIRRALHQLAIETGRVDVVVQDRMIVLTGSVASWEQRDAVESTAARTAGVNLVDNRIIVSSEAVTDEIC